MRHPEEVERFAALSRADGPVGVSVAAYQAGIPRAFWGLPRGPEAVPSCARDVVGAYVAKLDVARSAGYGLIFTGPNGAGKTTAAAWVALAVLYARMTVAYWTLPGLEGDLKRGFGDREYNDALRVMLNESDFVVLDELAKERKASGDDWMRVQVESVLKARYDEGLPTILISNGGPDAIGDVYGESVADLLRGRFRMVSFDDSKFRERARAAMDEAMGWE